MYSIYLYQLPSLVPHEALISGVDTLYSGAQMWNGTKQKETFIRKQIITNISLRNNLKNTSSDMDAEQSFTKTYLYDFDPP